MHDFMTGFIPIVAAGIEFCGIMVIVVTVLKEMYNIIVKYKFDFAHTERDATMNLGLANALEILLGAEILKTIAYRDIRQLVEVAALILIRVFMTVLIHWEMNHKLKQKEETLMDHKIDTERQRKASYSAKQEEDTEKNI
ncbi:MAG: DUF1622 domain-containing protein [Gallicola sp.]|uniref:DUF1622 domain-containing protein n=1 Tax=Gallicola sp. Sow4_E12 TaxID=3438785 RepID=UPI0017BD6A42|nr:DUF1622 domain-containing protein [Gallicola sp.]